MTFKVFVLAAVLSAGTAYAQPLKLTMQTNWRA